LIHFYKRDPECILDKIVLNILSSYAVAAFQTEGEASTSHK